MTFLIVKIFHPNLATPKMHLATPKRATFPFLPLCIGPFLYQLSLNRGAIMGLFDTIEHLTTADDRPVSPKPQAQHLPIPPATASTTPKVPAHDHHQTTADDDSQNIWQASPAEIEERRSILNRKPERLSFLSPCPVCRGRAFLHIDGGGFVCRTCQPGLFGHPVEAAGPDRPTRAKDADLLLAGDHHETAATIPAANDEPTEQQRAHFAAAWPWIKENKPALLAAGWTMAALVRRARYRWPYGPWGVAWLPVWSKPGVAVSIGRRGEIAFVFSSGGRTITQAAIKPVTKRCNNRTLNNGDGAQ